MPLTTITHYYDVNEARIVAGFLESHGIAAHINGQHLAAADLGMIVALGGLALQVSDADAEQARQLIFEAQTAGAETCPGCGSQKLWKQPKAGQGLVAILASLFGGASQSSRHTPHRRCLSCSHQWLASDDPQDEARVHE
jgi:hypothetical protein